MTPRISVIVPFRNGMRELPALFDALERQTLPAEEFEVIWVDDASTDGGPAWLQKELRRGWRLLDHAASRGSYAARNTGLRAATSGSLAFTDVDCRPHADWLARGLEALASTRRVAGRIAFTLSERPTTAERVDSSRFFRQHRYVQEGFGATANLFVARDVFQAVGEFDERLRYGGDYEFGRRCTAARIPIRYGEEAIVSHPARATIRGVLRKAERVGFGAGQVLRLDGSPWRALGARAVDRLALAVRRDAAPPAAERNESTVGHRSVRVTAVLCLAMAATAAGSLRGLAASVPTIPSSQDPRDPQRAIE